MFDLGLDEEASELLDPATGYWDLYFRCGCEIYYFTDIAMIWREYLDNCSAGHGII